MTQGSAAPDFANLNEAFGKALLNHFFEPVPVGHGPNGETYWAPSGVAKLAQDDLVEVPRVIAREARQRRLLHGWSQGEIAERMSSLLGSRWHQTTVAKTESGERPLKVHEFLALCLALGSTPLEMLGDSPIWESIHQEAIRRQRRITAVARDAALALMEHLPAEARSQYRAQLDEAESIGAAQDVARALDEGK